MLWHQYNTSNQWRCIPNDDDNNKSRKEEEKKENEMIYQKWKCQHDQRKRFFKKHCIELTVLWCTSLFVCDSTVNNFSFGRIISHLFMPALCVNRWMDIYIRKRSFFFIIYYNKIWLDCRAQISVSQVKKNTQIFFCVLFLNFWTNQAKVTLVFFCHAFVVYILSVLQYECNFWLKMSERPNGMNQNILFATSHSSLLC